MDIDKIEYKITNIFLSTYVSAYLAIIILIYNFS